MSTTIAEREDLIYTEALDPADKRPYSLDWTDVLAEVSASETASSVVYALDAAATTAGVEIDASSTTDPNTTVVLKVNASNQADAGFDNDGTDFSGKATMTSSSSYTFERTFKFTVRQR